MSQLPVEPAWRLAERAEEHRWLVTGLWAEQAVGIVGGEPKCCKSFLALDLAVAVAGGVPCLRRFAVSRPGRVRLALDRATPDELQELLVHALQKAGAVKLMTPELIASIADHAQGNPRALMNIAGELLSVAAQREARHIDEKLFLEICAAPPVPETKTARQRR